MAPLEYEEAQHAARSTQRTGQLEALVAVVVPVVQVARVNQSAQHAPQHEREVNDLGPEVVPLGRDVADDELREHLEGLVGGVAHDAAHVRRPHLLLPAAFHQVHERVALRVHPVLRGILERREQQLREALARTYQLANLLRTHRASLAAHGCAGHHVPTTHACMHVHPSSPRRPSVQAHRARGCAHLVCCSVPAAG